MKNRKLSEKIKDLKQQLDQVTQDITDVHYENVNEQIFNISLEKKEFLEKVNSEISRSLDVLDEDNEKLFSKISYLKNEVEKAIENFDKESH
ncbi:MAG: hypothetical protein K2G54_02585, partial [Malacoplasma sp.]|nr:hypothetical protein [Malacoplasma sp.]